MVMLLHAPFLITGTDTDSEPYSWLSNQKIAFSAIGILMKWWDDDKVNQDFVTKFVFLAQCTNRVIYVPWQMSAHVELVKSCMIAFAKFKQFPFKVSITRYRTNCDIAHHLHLQAYLFTPELLETLCEVVSGVVSGTDNTQEFMLQLYTLQNEMGSDDLHTILKAIELVEYREEYGHATNSTKWTASLLRSREILKYRLRQREAYADSRWFLNGSWFP
jgi:hypothetical protein